MALRSSDRTTTIRVKLVASIRMAGTSDRTVIATSSSSESANWPLPLEALPSPTLPEMSDCPVVDEQPATMKTAAARSSSRLRRRRFIEPGLR